MTDSVTIEEAQSNLADLVGRAERGEEIVISREGAPVVRLVPVVPARPSPPPGERRQLGLWRGKVAIPPDIEDPLPDDLIDLFYDGGPNDPLNWPPDKPSE